MKLPCFLLRLVAVLSVGVLAGRVEARVVRVEVLSRTVLAHDDAKPGIQDYEKIVARVYFAVKPTDERNRRIVDLEKASRNADGEVEFSADLFLMRPVQKGNGALLLEIPNRGGKGILSLLDGGKADPESGADLGDGWLLRKGFTFASLGWQWDVVDAPGNLRLYAPIAKEVGGKTIQGLLRDDFTPSEAVTEMPLGHVMGDRLGGVEYPVAAPEDSRDVLTVRDSYHGAKTIIPRERWSFSHTVNGKLAASDRFFRLDSGFLPGKIYELVYVVQDPVVAGLGFAAVRDFVAWMKHSPDSLGSVNVAYAAGISQCGRFLRDFLYEGFNADEQGRMALDGVLAHVGGAGRGSFNYRFAQPSRDAQPMSSIDYPTDIFPYTDEAETDPHHPKNGPLGLLDAAMAEHVVPKIFFSHTSYEYWGRAASLIHTSADAKTDAPVGKDVRIYFYSGLQHFSVPFPPQIGTGDRSSQQLPSPLPIRWFWRAMVANMDAWVRGDKVPPPSRYPHVADGTLVPVKKLLFPKLTGVALPTSANEGWDLDFGAKWRAGILGVEPPAVDGDYPTLVPQVDADGNDLGGIRLPEIVAPLATYTGWNLRASAIGASTERTAFLGSLIPFHEAEEEAAIAHDPRRSIQSRYKSFDDYLVRFKQGVDGLIQERYILPEDREHLIERAKPEWDWTSRFYASK